ncbi:methyltransferase domain-containing protein [Clostridium sp. LCP25S3_F8]|uniref:class I SAM-dependent methyltransferase n=1 Tax=Clostridium sp. LCP25S3_F8 TaxID=3438751 RepID=UPI003F8F6DB6
MKKYGKDINSLELWNNCKDTNGYVDSLEDNYHKHRLHVIKNLIPENLYEKGKVVFDFGCGNAVMFKEFLDRGAQITGVDISKEMIKDAHIFLESLGYDKIFANVGDVSKLKSIPTESLDAILSFNVIAYLTDEEERIFYKEAARVIRPGGSLIVTHSNELFDMFTFNKFTLDFFYKNFKINNEDLKKLQDILEKTKDMPTDKITYNIRENPLNYYLKLRNYGFIETRQEFINFHSAPPLILGSERKYINTLDFEEKDRWKLFFQCSTFASVSVKE